MPWLRLSCSRLGSQRERSQAAAAFSRGSLQPDWGPLRSCLRAPWMNASLTGSLHMQESTSEECCVLQTQPCITRLSSLALGGLAGLRRHWRVSDVASALTRGRGPRLRQRRQSQGYATGCAAVHGQQTSSSRHVEQADQNSISVMSLGSLLRRQSLHADSRPGWQGEAGKGGPPAACELASAFCFRSNSSIQAVSKAGASAASQHSRQVPIAALRAAAR